MCKIQLLIFTYQYSDSLLLHFILIFQRYLIVLNITLGQIIEDIKLTRNSTKITNPCSN